MLRRWELRNGNILVVEDAKSASLVIIGKDLNSQEDKISALEEILHKMRS